MFSQEKKNASSHLVSDSNRPSENVGQVGMIFRKYDKNTPNPQQICRITCILKALTTFIEYMWYEYLIYPIIWMAILDHTCLVLAFPPGKVMALGHRATAQWSRRWPWATSSSETLWHGHSSHENSNATGTVAENTPTTPGIICTGTPDIIKWPQTYTCPSRFSIWRWKDPGDPRTPRPFQWNSMPS